MAVQPQTPYKEYTANGSTKSFALEFDCENQDHLIVLVDDMEPVVGTWSLSNGAVVFGAAPTNGKKIIIQRNTPASRSTNYKSSDNSFRPDPVNKDFDRIWLKLQELGVADILLRIYVDRLHMEQKSYIDDQDRIIKNIVSDLRNYVDQQDGALSNDIGNLRTYVNQQDNNQKSYFENLIGQQGVSLQQLNNYYNYLMQRIAAIAVDKGWDASFVVDASGKSQQALNYANYKILTLEEFGGKTYQEDPDFDNSTVIDSMFRSIYEIYDTTTGLTSIEIRTAINNTQPITIKLNGLYRTTKSFHMPPNISIEQCFEGYFSQNPKAGIFYDPIDLNTYAVAPLLYKRGENNLYSVNTDVMFMPSGFDFDNGNCIMAGVRQQLINTFVITKRGVTLAYRLVGWAGCYAENIGCGENQSTWSRNPKVALLIASAWGARINGINTLSTHQGFVSYNSNGGLVVDGMYADQTAIQDYAETHDLIEPIYKPANFTETGTTGIMQMGEVKFNSPICELWYHGHVSSDRVSVDEPHFERLGGYNFYLLNCEADIKFKGVTAVEAISLFYLKDYRNFGREVKARGLLSMGGHLVKGENSDPSLILDVLRPHSFIQFYKWGDINLIKSVENKWGIDTIYVNPVNGNDDFVGLRDIRALKTLTHVRKICELFKVKTVNIMSEITVESGTVIPNEVIFTGSKIKLSGYLGVSREGFFDINFRNSQIESLSSTAILLFSGQFNYGKLSATADINSPSSTLMQATNTLDADVNIRNASTKLGLIAYSQLDKPSPISWVVYSTDYSVSFNTGGGAYFKSVCTNLNTGSLAMISESLAANATKTYDIPVQIARPGMTALATHSVYTDGLTYTATVKSKSIAAVSVRNTTTSSIQIPDGEIVAKVY